jgi:hypothetical protein
MDTCEVPDRLLPEIDLLALMRPAGPLAACVVIDGVVVDVSGFLDAHPGGAMILMANLGQDATEDFGHVAAHSRPAVRRRLEAMAVGRLRATRDRRWDALISQVCLIRNAFWCAALTPSARVLYVGHAYAQLRERHVALLRTGFREFLGEAGSEADAVPVDPETPRVLPDVFAASAADAVVERMGEAAYQLFDGVLALIAAAVDSPQTEQARALEAVRFVDEWERAESEYWGAAASVSSVASVPPAASAPASPILASSTAE